MTKVRVMTSAGWRGYPANGWKVGEYGELLILKLFKADEKLLKVEDEDEIESWQVLATFALGKWKIVEFYEVKE